MFTRGRLSVVLPAQSSTNDSVIDGIELQSKTSQDAQPSTVSQSKTSIHVTALDGIVNVNSLFTMAIFIGFSLTVPANGSAGHPASCNASIDTVRRLIVFEVISFSFFLFSSLIAQSLKLTINLLNSLDATDPHKADIDSSVLKYGLFGSAIGSVMGCLFLTLSIVGFIQVKLGVLSCGGEPVYAVVTLVVFVGSSLLVYVFTSVYASFFIIESQSNASIDTQNPAVTTTTSAAATTGRSKTSVHVTALDGIVNVNSLFTMATFIGFSLTVPAAGSAGNPESCNPSINAIRRLIVFEVISFSFFLSSSLIAQSLKLAINLLNSLDASDPHKADIDSSFHKYALFGSAIGSIMGCVFLMLSIVEFIQVKLGVLSCGEEPVYGVVTLVVFVGSGLLGLKVSVAGGGGCDPSGFGQVLLTSGKIVDLGWRMMVRVTTAMGNSGQLSTRRHWWCQQCAGVLKASVAGGGGCNPGGFGQVLFTSGKIVDLGGGMMVRAMAGAAVGNSG
ncbi:unnamed protein product [Fraxinus pennsylvanica]|uniref:Transmembrane protein n=1 Tax=Fraxinus pennsylvanica TaxID=56036 RepID=A0AAD1ZJK5_9LAMI|nr:unnamed protein product [Fraxinus pennsylvanica]